MTLETRYRASLLGLTDQLRTRLRALYDRLIDPADLDASFAAFIPRLAPLVRAGQSAGVSLSTAYLSALILREAGRTARLPIDTSLVGRTEKGVPLDEGMAAWPVLVKAQIGRGASTEEALAYGRFLAERFSDGEVTRVVDEQTEHATRRSRQFSGWFGIVSPTACRECGVNQGPHPLGAQMYRHGSCNCSRIFTVA